MDARRDLNGSATSPHELDVVEVVVDTAEVPRGTKGTVVHDFSDGTLMLEVVGEEGRPEGLPCVSRQDVRDVLTAWVVPDPADPTSRPRLATTYVLRQEHRTSPDQLDAP
jgi:hypothetical protein